MQMNGIGIDMRQVFKVYLVAKFDAWEGLTRVNIIMLQVNPEFIGAFEEAGLKFVGKDETGNRMEVGSHL